MCMRMHVVRNTAGVKLKNQHVKIKKHKNKTKYFIDLTDNSVAFYTLPQLKMANKGYISLLRMNAIRRRSTNIYILAHVKT